MAEETHRGPVVVPGCPLIWRGTSWVCDDDDHFLLDGSGESPVYHGTAVPPPSFWPPTTPARMGPINDPTARRHFVEDFVRGNSKMRGLGIDLDDWERRFEESHTDQTS